VGEVVARIRGMADFTYHGDDQKRRDSEKAGLIAPGDVGYFDEDGFLYLCDRAKDMIISGGVNIYPAEIEAVLHGHPQVLDVAVFGTPDDEWGESVYCIVQPKPGETIDLDELRAFAEANMARYKVPRGWETRDELPRTDAGKLLKRVLRDEFWPDRAV
jgi:long-chain acyl-CoA synthetase